MIRRAAPALVLLGACGDNAAAPIDGPPASVPAIVDLALPPERELDLLYIAPGGCCVGEEDNEFRRAIGDLVAGIVGEGSIPDLHVGVISSDLGVLGMNIDQACSQSDEGHLLNRYCSSVDGTYLRDIDDGAGGRTTNYSGTLVYAMTCLLTVAPDMDCAIEQNLEAIRVAIEDADGINAGFLRDTAQLAIITVMDDDDCSAFNPELWGPESNELGPIDHFRCWDFGVECDEPDMRAEGPRTNCRPREDSPYLYPVQRYIDYMASYKPGRVLVHGIIGPPEPVEISRRMPLGDTLPRPSMLPSCRNVDAGGGTAWPAIRLHTFIESFADRGGTTSSCEPDFSDAMRSLGERIHDRLVGQPCLRHALPDPAAPDCNLVLTQIGQPPMPLVACDATASNPPCWRLVPDPSCGTPPADLRIDAVGIEHLQGRHVQGRCEVIP